MADPLDDTSYESLEDRSTTAVTMVEPADTLTFTEGSKVLYPNPDQSDGGRVPRPEDLGQGLQTEWSFETTKETQGPWVEVIRQNIFKVTHQIETDIEDNNTGSLDSANETMSMDVVKEPLAEEGEEMDTVIQATEPDSGRSSATFEDEAAMPQLSKSSIRMMGSGQSIRDMAQGFGETAKSNTPDFGLVNLPSEHDELNAEVDSSALEVGRVEMPTEPTDINYGERDASVNSASPKATSPTIQSQNAELLNTLIPVEVKADTQTPTTDREAKGVAATTETAALPNLDGSLSAMATALTGEQPKATTEAEIHALATEEKQANMVDAVEKPTTIDAEHLSSQRIENILAELHLTLDPATVELLEQSDLSAYLDDMNIEPGRTVSENGEDLHRVSVESQTIADAPPAEQYQQHTAELGRLIALLAASHYGAIESLKSDKVLYEYTGQFSSREALEAAIKDQAAVTEAASCLVDYEQDLNGLVLALPSRLQAMGIEASVAVRIDQSGQPLKQWQTNPPSTIAIDLRAEVMRAVITPSEPTGKQIAIGIDKQAIATATD